MGGLAHTQGCRSPFEGHMTGTATGILRNPAGRRNIQSVHRVKQLHNRVILLVLVARSPYQVQCSCQQESDRRATTFASANSTALHNSFITTTVVRCLDVIVLPLVRCLLVRVIRDIVMNPVLPACRSHIERRRSGSDMHGTLTETAARFHQVYGPRILSNATVIRRV